MDKTLIEGDRVDGLLNDHILYTHHEGAEVCFSLAEHDAALIHQVIPDLRAEVANVTAERDQLLADMTEVRMPLMLRDAFANGDRERMREAMQTYWNRSQAFIETVCNERDRYWEDSKRFEWLAEALDFDVKIGDADPEAFLTEENQSPVDAWRQAIDCAIGLGHAEALAGTGEAG